MISRDEFWRLFRFGLVGGGATLIDLGTSALLLWLWPSLAENLVSTSAFFVAFWFSFFGHRYITFQKQGAVGKFLLVARPAAASPAVGYYAKHNAQQKAVIENAFGEINA